MFTLTTTSQFEKDVKRCKKRGYKIHLLQRVFQELELNGNLPLKYKPHKLVGNYTGFWECHIQPDWLLIWYVSGSEIVLTRTGTHSDLF
ncbi:MAG: type II toxin-antitoxin system YafQ family toxin [Chitinophagaceae bacterium]|nr:type II toxin-antitoxin system YafQ family toxin [Chitinophagaceae bacterium]